MFTTMFNQRDMFWQQSQNTVVRIERDENKHDTIPSAGRISKT